MSNLSLACAFVYKSIVYGFLFYMKSVSYSRHGAIRRSCRTEFNHFEPAWDVRDNRGHGISWTV